MVKLTEPFTPTPQNQSQNKGGFNSLRDLVGRGFDLTKPRILLSADIRERVAGNTSLVSLLFISQQPPKTDWYRTSDARFARIANRLLTSIVFTGDSCDKTEWVKCVVCYGHITPLFPTGTRIFLEPPPEMGTGKLYDPHEDPSSITVVIAWMHHQDVFLFLSKESFE